MKEETASSLNPRLQGYVVAFVDIMGQSQKLKQMRECEWWKLDDQTRVLLSETYGRVRRLRELISGFLDRVLKPSPIAEAFLSSNPSKEEIEYWEASRPDFRVDYISDSIVAIVPTQVKSGVFPFSSILAIMGASCFAILSSFVEHRLIRVGIALGPCVFDPNTDEIYGSAISIAVELEKLAEWPRILVDSEIIRVAEIFAYHSGDNTADRLNSGFAKRCLSLITEDIDGKQILDYLGPGIRQFYDIPDEIVYKAKTFIQSQLSENAENKKILDRYNQVNKYFVRHDIA